MHPPAVYCDREILNGIAARDILIDPFEERSLGTSSYDLRLGEWYYREQPLGLGVGTGTNPAVFNPFDERDVTRVWGQPQKAVATNLRGMSGSSRVIWIDPGETILAHTAEFIGARDHITTMMKARSSYGRCFIEVCKCAGWGDVGYVNRWTMEVTNNSRWYRIPLVVGMRISQMVFFETGTVRDIKKQYGANDKYQDGGDLSALKEAWEPSMMLPRLHLDRELRVKDAYQA